MKDADVIVIGSGAGGMAAAVALARANKRVMVFEQHYLPGGWCHSFPMGDTNSVTVSTILAIWVPEATCARFMKDWVWPTILFS